MTFEAADRVDSVPPSGIRRFFELAEEMDDIISLGVGEPDFSAPWAAREAAIASLERGQTSYTANRGKRELRERIADYEAATHNLQYDPDEEILVTAGASEGLDLAFRALLNPGDSIAIAQPATSRTSPARRSPGSTLSTFRHARKTSSNSPERCWNRPARPRPTRSCTAIRTTPPVRR